MKQPEMSEDSQRKYDRVIEFVESRGIFEFMMKYGNEVTLDAMLYAAICGIARDKVSQTIHEELILRGTYERITDEIRELVKSKCSEAWKRLEQAN